VGTQKTTYQYDVLGNLVSVTLPSGKTISYVVDAENRRVAKKINGSLTEGLLYDGNRIVAQLNSSNQLVSQFVYATGSTSPDYMLRGGVTYRIFSDQLGSPELVVNTATGAIAEQITYDEFGNVLSDTNPGFQPFGFAGGLYDQDTKLVRFGERDYSPVIGRWTAKDPIQFDGGDTNLYGYVLNDPVNLVDPRGLDSAVLNLLTDRTSQAFAQNYQSDSGVLTVVVHGSNTPGKVYIDNKTEVKTEDLANKIVDKNARDDLLHGQRYKIVHLIVCHGNKGKPSVKQQLQNLLPNFVVLGSDEKLTITSDGHVTTKGGGAVNWR
jgi:RHS repeat-associated protein